MSIKAGFRIALAAWIGIIAIAISAFFYGQFAFYEDSSRGEQLDRIFNEGTQLVQLTQEVLLYGEQRAVVQWWRQYREVEGVLGGAQRTLDPASRTVLTAMSRRIGQLPSLQEKITELRASSHDAPAIPILMSQLFQESTQLQASLREVKSISDQAIKFAYQNARRRQIIIFGGLFGVAILYGMITLLMFHSTVLTPLRRLGQTIHAIREGRKLRVQVQSRDEIGAVCRVFNALLDEQEAAQERAEAGSRAKSEFLANMSHEIRTPLNAVLGLAQVLTRTRLAAEQRDYVDKILTSGRSLLGIVNDILDYSKIDAGKLVLEPTRFRLDQILANLAGILTVSTRDKALDVVIDVAPDVPDRLVGDALHLEQVLINLTSNAIKFTHQGRICLGIRKLDPSATDRLADTEKTVLRFEVRDTGIGIAAQTQARLFSSFAQADSSSTRRYGGTGLGLAICKRIVALMNGEIGVDSAPGQGSTFWFTAAFQVDPADAAAPVDAHELAGRPAVPLQGPLQVLVVDPDPSALAALRGMIHRINGEAICVSSGAQARAWLDAAPASCAFSLVDGRVPQGEWELLRPASGKHSGRGPPLVLMLTPHDADHLDPTCPALFRVTQTIVKPVTADGLRALIKTLATEPPRLPDRPVAVGADNGCGGEKSHDSSTGLGPAVKTETGEPARLAGLTILLVEDNEINQDVARSILEMEGARVVVVEDGAEAVDCLRTDAAHFSLVLMDVQMPVMDGLEATRAVRTDLGLDQLPVIALTAGTLPTDREACRAAGMNDFIPKPIDAEHMISAIRTAAGDAAPAGLG